MSSSIIPTQLGYTPPGSTNGSQLVLGKDVTVVNFEAVGLGKGGRPDILNTLIINITNDNQKVISISIAGTDMLTLMSKNSNSPSNAIMKIKEAAICEQDDNGNTAEKRILILASDSYDPAPAKSTTNS